MARKPKVGQPKAVLTQPTRPTNEECKEAYSNIEVGDLEKGFDLFYTHNAYPNCFASEPFCNINEAYGLIEEYSEEHISGFPKT